MTLSPDETPVSKASRVTRSSLACLPCRSRHLKCDGQRPNCTRCAETDKQCEYAPSRRGGLDRAALGERRKRLAGAETREAIISVAGFGRRPSASGQQSREDLFSPSDVLNGEAVVGGTGVLDILSGTTSPPVTDIGDRDLAKDGLFNAYYEHFHKLHPFLLPRSSFLKLYQSPDRQTSLNPLVAAMRFIGNFYRQRTWSFALQASIIEALAQASPSDPFVVQSRLLYSIALFWHTYGMDAKREMDATTQLARSLGMFRREFAAEHGCGDPVLEECWRRTWWMVFIVDAYYAGTLGTMNFSVQDVEATVDLPCEEHEYESGNIPEPKTLEDFDSRELALEDVTFSSFAYLIGAVRCAALAISTSPKIATKDASEQVVQAADSIIDGWLLLLPKGTKEVMGKSGEIDELMFQAHLVVHVSTIGLHRPLSDLRFNAVEDISSCARPAPLDTPTPVHINVHTIRVLRSVESQIRLLTLPARPFHHTPFTTCMVSEGTLALLSACNFLFRGKELAVARDQIRMTIGCLKALGEIWTRTARNVQEIQTIARHVLRVKESNGNNGTPQLSRLSSLPSSEEPRPPGSETDSMNVDVFSGIQDLSTLCGWYNMPDEGQDLLWMTNPDGA